MALMLAALSALAYSLADLSGGYAARCSPAQSVVVVSQCLGALLAIAFVAVEGTPNPSRTDLL